MSVVSVPAKDADSVGVELLRQLEPDGIPILAPERGTLDAFAEISAEVSLISSALDHTRHCLVSALTTPRRPLWRPVICSTEGIAPPLT